MTGMWLGIALWTAPVGLAQDDPLDDIPEAEGALSGSTPEADEPEIPLDEPEPESASADAYRQAVNALMEASAEERLAGWEAYLEAHPKSPFAAKVREEIATAEAELYGHGIHDEVDALQSKRGIAFPEGVLLENLNPATRIRAGFDFGFPSYINLMADAEYALNPQLSGHFGLRKRLTGWAIEAGPRVALVKLEDPDLIVSIAGDVHVGVNPAILGLRPTLMVGIRPIEPVAIQLQGSPEFERIDGNWGTRYRGGANVTVRLAQPVAVYGETLLETKYVHWPGGGFRFYTAVFGMRFYPMAKAKREDVMDVILGGTVPFFYNYWNAHKGSATAQVVGYLE